MDFEKTADGTKMTIRLTGEIDSVAAGEMKDILVKESDGVTELIFDLTELEYISSGGLRMLHIMKKKMKSQGEMSVINANDEIMSIFKVTGFNHLLDIQ